jgi:hypothetical protein
MLLGVGTRAASVFAVVIGALIFAAFHYIGPFADPFDLHSFTFRVLRSFGVTAWTHALYDSFLLLF